VTGGAGFIGSHVVDRFADDGHDVVVVDVRSPHRPDVEFHDVDLLDLPGLVRATRGCEFVFHLAGVSNVNEAHDHPVETTEVNITGTAKVWEAARRNEVRRAVLASTVWVYAGARGPGPLAEDIPFHLPDAGHIYTSSKIACELVVHNYYDLYGQDFTILRYGIPFGPRMRQELVIPRFVRMALDGEPITVHGDGSQYRNYIYVEDLVDAHARTLNDAAVNEVFNLEGPDPVTIRRVVESIRDAVGHHVVIEFLPARAGDYPGRVVCAEKARELLGWEPSITFEDGLRRYIDWYVADAEADGEAREA
jgi:UDP-glucose 4-epimerase